MAFYGTNGAIFADRIGYEIYPRSEARLKTGAGQGRDRGHAKHFIACVQGKAQTRADVEVGHRATTVGLLGNIAYRTRLKLQWDGKPSSSTVRRRLPSCCGGTPASLGIWCRNRKPGILSIEVVMPWPETAFVWSSC